MTFSAAHDQESDAPSEASSGAADTSSSAAGDARAPLFRALVGASQGMNEVRDLVSRIAPSEATVLILGETGTGKEVVARNIHHCSPRGDGPFVAINCGAIPPDLLESELFGHEKGSFTGALSSRKGRFELAAGGTLFLDEIGDMRLDMQVKLLRVLQEQRFDRIGGTRSIGADVRIVAATHRNLEEMMAAGTFREDLYYRLDVVSIEMPPLRERREDIALLISELAARLGSRRSASVEFEGDAMQALLSYDWPGNVRELANLVERCMILSPAAPVGLDGLPPRIRGAAAARNEVEDSPTARLEALTGTPFEDYDLGGDDFELKGVLEGIEVRLIRRALRASGGVIAQAAKQLGLRRTTLVEKIRKLGLDKTVASSRN